MLTELLEEHDFLDLDEGDWLELLDSEFPAIPQASDWDERVDPQILSGMEADFREVWEG